MMVGKRVSYDKMIDDLVEDYICDMTTWLENHPEESGTSIEKQPEFLLHEDAMKIAKTKSAEYKKALVRLPPEHIENLYESLLAEI